MGNDSSKNQAPMDEQDLAKRYKLTPAQIHALVTAFKTEGESKPAIDQKHFVKVVSKVKETNPELAGFNDEITALVFSFCDSDHNDKVDPFEVIAALAVFASGDIAEKAKLVFKVIDRDGNQFLSKDEIRKHARNVLAFSAALVKSDIKTKAKEADMGTVGSMAAWAIGAALGAMEKQFAEDVARDVFTNDANKDNKISLDEWLAAAQTNNTIRALIDPNLSANAWRVIYGEDALTGDQEASNLLLERLKTSPKGLACIFDMQQEDGKFKPVGPGVPATPPGPPAPLSINFVASRGGASATTTQQRSTTSTYGQLLDAAVTLSDLPRDHIVLKKGDTTLDGGEEQTLVELGLASGDTLEVVDYLKWEGDVNVKSLTGKVIQIALTPTNTVAEFKQKVQDKEGIPPDQQRLIFKGRQLSELTDPVSKYRIVPGVTLHIILRLRASP